MLNYYFDSTWTTKDIAEHFKLSVSVVAAWFQRADIAALIDFVTAANERRARDIARESLPGTIDILHRISRLRDNDKLSRAAASALITFARGRPKAKSAATRAAAASTRSRSAEASPPRDRDSEHDTSSVESTAPGPSCSTNTSTSSIRTSAPPLPDPSCQLLKSAESLALPAGRTSSGDLKTTPNCRRASP
jgi:hypothetical protein